ncbi:MAG: hypothetical protein E7244_02210 [Enterocloster citroniae]|nr:hypothetical protein [Enterocloster citroniae]
MNDFCNQCSICFFIILTVNAVLPHIVQMGRTKNITLITNNFISVFGIGCFLMLPHSINFEFFSSHFLEETKLNRCLFFHKYGTIQSCFCNNTFFPHSRHKNK